jgi:hypothetical protein
VNSDIPHESHQIVQLLTDEKKLVYEEKLGLIKTTKGILGLIVPILIFLVAIIEKENTRIAYLVVPFLSSATVLFLLSNLHTLNLVTEYLDRLDLRIQEEFKTPLPLFQRYFGKIILDSGAYLTPDRKRVGPYTAFGLNVALITVAIAVWGIVQGHQYLKARLDVPFYWFAFDTFAAISLIYTIYSAIQYGFTYDKLRKRLFDEVLTRQQASGNVA